MHRNPVTQLATHEVTNQPPPFEGVNLYDSDVALKDAVTAAAATEHHSHLSHFGAQCGAAETIQAARQANETPPRLHTHDRFGQRLDEVSFHPAYHQLMALGLDSGISAAAWSQAHGHALHGAMMILMGQADAGVTCPMSMTYASVAALRAAPGLAALWSPRITAQSYDPRFIPAQEKSGVTIGMAMTEKQGGSDVRANATRAEVTDDGYVLTGHKWFCSAPMCDAFLTLAQTDAGLSCFLVPRWRPDGSRNAIHIMRLKDKMGDRSNASSEIEYHGAYASVVGEEGRGIPTIIEMVQLTRYDCVLGSAGGMRAALTQALWHANHRTAFQKKLIDQPAMSAVLADLALESEAATSLALRLGAALDGGESDFARLAIPAAKFWICKRQPGMVYEALEALGGAGYVEDGPMPRLYRQSPLNAIWEGSGNVIALDILRAIARAPDSVNAVLEDISGPANENSLLAAALETLKSRLTSDHGSQAEARGTARDLALALQAAALHRSAPSDIFEAFCSQRLDPARNGLIYGDLAPGIDASRIVTRAQPL